MFFESEVSPKLKRFRIKIYKKKYLKLCERKKCYIKYYVINRPFYLNVD